MGMDAIFTLLTLVMVLGLLVFTRLAADIVLFAALTILMVMPMPKDGGGWKMGVFENVGEALSGFANPGPITVGVLYIVVAAVRETGGIDWLANRVLGRPKTVAGAQARLMGPVAVLSAFLNNTPVVALFIPAVDDWARRLRFSPSKLMLPLSYAAILGGMCTLIGTSTNLVVNGLMIAETDNPGLGMFDIAWLGLPCALVGALVVLVLGRWLLPERKSVAERLQNPREYTMEMMVEVGGPLVGKSIDEAGLRNLPSAYLAEIDRDGDILAAVAPTERLKGGDRLVFAGVVESMKDLQNMRGLIPATNQVFRLDGPRYQRNLTEAVVSDTCPLVGKSIREGRFRTVYNAAVIAVARNGKRISAKIGDIVLRPGDTLLLEAPAGFAARQRDSRDFFLVSQVEDSQPRRFHKAWIATAILMVMVVFVAVGWLDMLPAAMLAAGAMLVTRCLSTVHARASIDWSVLMVIVAALGVGKALDVTGAAGAIAQAGLSVAGDHPWLALFAVYLITTFFTEIITNNAAVALVFPIALATADKLDVNVMPFIFCVMIAGSASFATPLGYQTNLMVYGPGGYRFTDYMRIGIPMNLSIGITAVLLAPFLWPF